MLWLDLFWDDGEKSLSVRKTARGRVWTVFFSLPLKALSSRNVRVMASFQSNIQLIPIIQEGHHTYPVLVSLVLNTGKPAACRACSSIIRVCVDLALEVVP